MRKCGNIERSQHALPVPDLMVLQKTFSQEKNALDLVQKKTLESHLAQPQACSNWFPPRFAGKVRQRPRKAPKQGFAGKVQGRFPGKFLKHGSEVRFQKTFNLQTMFPGKVPDMVPQVRFPREGSQLRRETLAAVLSAAAASFAAVFNLFNSKFCVACFFHFSTGIERRLQRKTC